MTSSLQIRSFVPSDRPACMALTTKLTGGMAPWRDTGGLDDVVRRWVAGSLDSSVAGTASVFVAERVGAVVGFVSAVSSPHFNGQLDCYVGELVVAEAESGQDTGRALMSRVEEWSREHNLTRIVLETGAHNTAARGFYAALGYEEEEVKLSRAV